MATKLVEKVKFKVKNMSSIDITKAFDDEMVINQAELYLHERRIEFVNDFELFKRFSPLNLSFFSTNFDYRPKIVFFSPSFLNGKSGATFSPSLRISSTAANWTAKPFGKKCRHSQLGSNRGPKWQEARPADRPTDRARLVGWPGSMNGSSHHLCRLQMDPCTYICMYICM